MPFFMPITLDAGAGSETFTVANVITALGSVYNVLVGLFTNVITTITGNALLYVPVLIALLAGLVMFAVKVIRKLGVRGVSSRR